jgi:hypothetical protein
VTPSRARQWEGKGGPCYHTSNRDRTNSRGPSFNFDLPAVDASLVLVAHTAIVSLDKHFSRYHNVPASARRQVVDCFSRLKALSSAEVKLPDKPAEAIEELWETADRAAVQDLRIYHYWQRTDAHALSEESSAGLKG